MISGVLNIYKEKGYTSHDVVAKLRGIVHQKRIGHTGTLDPDAVGVLPVCLGKATRLCDMLTDERKTYEAVLLLGRTTDTQDISGAVLAESPVTCTPEEVRAVLASFLGEQQQIPPMYSAIKVNGKKLYELAREGKEVERAPRTVHFYEIQVLSMQLPRVIIRVSCSKGTYIRTLCHDVGQALGCGGCMAELTRTRVGRFTESGALRLSRVAELAESGRLQEALVSIDQMFENYPTVSTSSHADGMAHNGASLPFGMVSNVLDTHLDSLPGIVGLANQEAALGALFTSSRVRVYDSVGQFIGIYQVDRGQQLMKPEKIFYDVEAAKEAEARTGVYDLFSLPQMASQA